MTSAADPHGRWLRRLVGYCWRYPKLVTFALLGSLVYTAVAVVIPLIQRDIVNNAILTHRQPIWIGATALIIAALIGFGGVFTRRYLGGRMSLDVQHDLRTEMFASLSRLDGARQDQLHRAGRQQVHLRRQHDPGPAGDGPVPDRQHPAVLPVADAMAFSPLLTVVAIAVGPALFLISLASRNKPSRQLGRAAACCQRRWRVDAAVTGSASSRASGRRNRRSSGSNGFRLLYAAGSARSG
jgi:ATP-binding cassette subfamily B protein